MPSSFTSRLKLERQASGENSGTWGNLVNYVLNRIDASTKGYQAVNVAGSANVTLTSNNSTSNTDDSATDDQVHNAILEFTGTLTANINVFTDAVETNYAVFNNTSGSFTLTFGPTGGAGVDIKQGTKTLVYTDGTTMYDITKDLGDIQVTGLTSNGNVSLKTSSTLKLEDDTGGEFVGLKANATTTSYTLTLPPTTGTANQVLQTDGSGNLSFGDVAGGISWQSVQTTGFTASAGNGYPCNTTSAGFTVTLPATPSAGDQVQIVDYAGTFDTNALTIDPNGEDIEGGTDNLQLTGEREGVILTYIDSTQGWIATSGINEGTNALSPEEYDIDFLVVAGGGGGGSVGNGGGNHCYGGGGGGAGGFRTSTQTGISPGVVITVTVGDGGSGGVDGGGSPAGTGTEGSSSSISGTGLTTITSAGGGKGGTEQIDGTPGGSGGGGGGYNGGPATVNGGSGNTPSTSPSQGNNGGSNGGSSQNSGGGGGGAGAVGSNAPSASTGGAGGNGTASSITGSSVTRAGGGAAGSNTEIGGTQALGGTGGGGDGPTDTTSAPTANGSPGTANTGGGGAGGGSNNAGTIRGGGGAGGKGVVILSMLDEYYSGTTTGSPTVATGVSGKTILTFTGSGSYTT